MTKGDRGRPCCSTRLLVAKRGPPWGGRGVVWAPPRTSPAKPSVCLRTVGRSIRIISRLCVRAWRRLVSNSSRTAVAGYVCMPPTNTNNAKKQVKHQVIVAAVSLFLITG